MELSIVIPTLNEEHKIDKDILEISRFLKDSNLSGEVIVVDDGSTDTTAAVARSVTVPDGIGLNVIRYEQNRGKGYAIRTGMNASKGEFAMFCDSGLCIPMSYALKGLELIKKGTCDIAHASRRHPDTLIRRSTSLHRKLVSMAFRTFVPPIMGIQSRLSDTQCGFKIYRGAVARELYSECTSDGFMFDIEIILRAERRGHRIDEFGIEWTSDPDTRIRLGNDAGRIIRELKAIKHALSSSP